MLDSIAASGAEVVTVSIRRISLDGLRREPRRSPRRALSHPAQHRGLRHRARRVLTAELAREALETNWLKLELIGDRETLYPDVEQLVRAAEELVRSGFVVLPYCNDDP